MADQSDFNDRIATASERHWRIDAADLASDRNWTSPGSAAARQLICQLHDAPTDHMAVLCASTIARSARWLDLAGELLAYAPLSSRMIRVLSRIVESHDPNHLIAEIANHPYLEVFSAFDGVIVGDIARIANRFSRPANAFSTIILLPTENPIGAAAAWTCCADEAGYLDMKRSDGTPLVGSRYTLPPAIVVGCSAEG